MWNREKVVNSFAVAWALMGVRHFGNGVEYEQFASSQYAKAETAGYEHYNDINERAREFASVSDEYFLLATYDAIVFGGLVTLTAYRKFTSKNRTDPQT